jgi:hypothetical protein
MDDQLLDKIVSFDEVVLRVSGKVHKHSAIMWGTENPRKVLMYKHANENVVFTAMSCKKLYSLFLFGELTITGIVNLDLLQNFFIPQMDSDMGPDALF